MVFEEVEGLYIMIFEEVEEILRYLKKHNVV